MIVKDRVRSQVVLLGPALVAAAAYVDPGNVASNTAAGARYGYLLVWVVVCANLMAGLVQYLSAKLGVLTGQSLPELLRDRLPRAGRYAYWLQAEVVTMATDLAEVLGGALALALLFDLPLLWGGIVTTAVSTLLLAVRTRRFEGLVIALLAVVAIGFVAGLFVAPPDPGGTLAGLVPAFAGGDSVLLAAAMLGATVMPHAVYAHSALARDRHGQAGPRLLSATRIDVTFALLVAGAVNLSLLLLGATALGGDSQTGTIEGVHAAVGAHLGAGVALLFAVGLLCSGLASTAVGSYAGGVVMGGLLHRTVPLVVRRLVTAVPALVVLAVGVDPTAALILSQVVLSFGIPFALIPLVVMTSSRAVLGAARNRPGTTVAAVVVCAAIVGLNLTLLGSTFLP